MKEELMRQWLLATSLVVLGLGYAAPAAACETCELYFDQTLDWCKRCVPAHYGWFQCVVRTSGSWDFCDDAYDV
ncbi:MAG TPA: hypothetical protein VF698_20685, partial [Thermoanaerobaculia bacterium]